MPGSMCACYGPDLIDGHIVGPRHFINHLPTLNIGTMTKKKYAVRRAIPCLELWTHIE